MVHFSASASASSHCFKLIKATQRLLRSAVNVSESDDGVNSMARLQYFAINSYSFALCSWFPRLFHNEACLICQNKIGSTTNNPRSPPTPCNRCHPIILLLKREALKDLYPFQLQDLLIWVSAIVLKGSLFRTTSHSQRGQRVLVK